MGVKPGYKQTEVGVIPEDWMLESIENLASITTGSRNTQDRVEDGQYPFFVRSQTVERINSYSFDGEAVLTAGDGVGTGKVFHYIKGRFDAHQRVYRVAQFNDHIDGFFFFLYFSTHFCDRIMQMTAKSSVDSVRRDMIARMLIPLPPLPEQRAIAEALSDVDGLLGGLDRLIAKKRDLKQAAMQQLLTGQTRLPGFHGEWQVKRLGDIGTFLKGSGVRKDEAQSGELPCVRYGEIYTHHNDYVRSFNSWISPAVAATAVRLVKGDILFAGSGETKEEIGKCVAFLDDREAYAGGDIVILRPKEADSVFMGYYCNTSPVQTQKASKGQGDAVVHISATALASIVVKLPSVPEQTAIAEVLTDMDAELAALEQRREKTRALKQAMMQALLTGRIRLIEKSNIIQFPSPPPAKPVKHAHNWQIDEAVIIGVLAAQFGTEKWPLPRKRRVKLTYLLHRHARRQTDAYQKKAAGPYNPKARYQGPEGIALKNSYVREHHNGKYAGLVAAEKIAQAEDYFAEWYPAAKEWLEQFRFEKTEELELLATVDMAVEDLRRDGQPIELGTVKSLIKDHPEWVPKLDRKIFSDQNIIRAIGHCENLFPS